MTRLIGVVPARMAASRFPGKPLHPILGRTMVEHVYERAKLYDRWDDLCLATCDDEIRAFGKAKGYPVVMTADTHTRALDRVAEAVTLLETPAADDDIVVCVQGDEPMLHPDMIAAVVDPIEADTDVQGTILAVHIVDEELYRNPDIVKLVADINGDVLYTSRSPIPYAKEFSPEIGAHRIGGIFGFRNRFLKTFTSMPESPLEVQEACDSNRFLDNGFRQRVAPMPHRPYFSVDSPSDIALVEQNMEADPLWGAY